MLTALSRFRLGYSRSPVSWEDDNPAVYGWYRGPKLILGFSIEGGFWNPPTNRVYVVRHPGVAVTVCLGKLHLWFSWGTERGTEQ